MAKKRRTHEKKKKKTIISIDMIPKCSQQPRSSPPKRRTDFSVFTCTPPPFSIFFNPDSSPGSSSGEIRLFNVTANSLKEKQMKVKQFPEGTLARCSNSQDYRSVCSSEFSDDPVMEVDSAVQDQGLNLASNRDASNKKIDIFKMSESTPHGSPVSDSNSLAVTPGSVVWARTACEMWWPAEIVEERSTLSDPACHGHVLVKFYGNHPSAWIDPMTCISAFEDSFVERSTNPSKDFQEALKQALQRLQRKEQLSSCRTPSSDRSAAHSDQQDHSTDKWTSCTSSTIMDDFQERRRGKRERKRKVHFDEVSYPLKPERKVRRLKIMRYLGLVAPVGSPFSPRM